MSGLALSRRVGESILIGDDIVVTVTAIRGNQVQILVQAPQDLRILRDELVEREESRDRS
jgi:carbon storage regulator